MADVRSSPHPPPPPDLGGSVPALDPATLLPSPFDPDDGPPQYVSRSNTPSLIEEPGDESSEENMQIAQQNMGGWGNFTPSPFHLEFLMDAGQLVMHKGKLRLSQVFNPDAVQRMEIVDETRRVLLHIEQDAPEDIEESFLFRLYNRNGIEVIEVLNPMSTTCICRGATWHWFRRCRFQAVIFSPPGVVAGFVRREHTCFVQEYHILSPQEHVLLVLRGGPIDLELYSPDLENELGRLSVHGWVGIMHEIKRTGKDVGMTFPMDLDVKVKAVLIGAMCAIDWLISTEAGKKLPSPPSNQLQAITSQPTGTVSDQQPTEHTHYTSHNSTTTQPHSNESENLEDSSQSPLVGITSDGLPSSSGATHVNVEELELETITEHTETRQPDPQNLRAVAAAFVQEEFDETESDDHHVQRTIDKSNSQNIDLYQAQTSIEASQSKENVPSISASHSITTSTHSLDQAHEVQLDVTENVSETLIHVAIENTQTEATNRSQNSLPESHALIH